MILGPVFRAELIRTSRRTRYYVMRMFYGFALLLVIWSRYEDFRRYYDERSGAFRQAGVLLSQLAAFAFQTFVVFVTVQGVILLILVPPLFGGVIADEKERKTLHYLMASRLSSREIVLDKLLARMLHVAIFMLLGLPILSSLSLLGGIRWDFIVGAYTGTFSTIFFAAALATLVSTLARRVRQGVLITYVLMIAWLFVPSIADPACRVLYPTFYLWFGPFNEWFQAASPVSLLIWNGFSRSIVAGPMTSVLLERFLWMIGLQTLAGVFFLLLAVQQLRPAFRRQETGTRRLNWFAAKRHRPRWLRRPDCGSDAMLWKECYFAQTDVFTKLFVLPATIVLTVIVILSSGVDQWVWRSLQEVYLSGYLGGFNARNQLNDVLRRISPLYISLWLLAVAGASASSVGSERDGDTWISLTSTPLSGWEILRGKMIGTVWGLRGFGGLIGLFWVAGLLIGALHPLGFLLGLLLVAIFTWGVVAVGTFASLTARSTSRAITATIALLIVVNGGYLVFIAPILSLLGDRELREFFDLGCTPYLTQFSLVSFDDVRGLFGTPDPTRTLAPLHWAKLRVALVIILGHILVALFLTTLANRRFDTVADRPS